jgi:hypothetical protein
MTSSTTSPFTAPPTTTYSRRRWSEAKLRRMQRDLAEGMFPISSRTPEINVKECI